MEKIAVLMATYNGEKYVKEQIDSILNQTCEIPFSLIIRDDGSTDSTCEILREYEKNGLVNVIYGENIGAAKSFLQLLKSTYNYNYYAFSDQDDVWFNNKLQKAYEKIKDIKGPAIYCSNSVLVDENLQSLGRNTHRKLPTYNTLSILTRCSCAQGCTSLLNNELADVIQKYGIPDQFIMHDSLISFLCVLLSGSIIYDHDATMLYRQHSNNVFGIPSKKQNGLVGLIKRRVADIIKKDEIGMSIQCREILNTYESVIPHEKMKVGKLIVNCQNSFICRLRLVFNKNLKADTFNKTISQKMKILLGNN